MTTGQKKQLGLVLLSVACGITATSAFQVGVAWTNTQQFCISCHEMNTFVYEPSLGSTHANNGPGTTATCPDCHVPQALGPKILAKIRATSDLYHHFAGTIDTREEFDARHLDMAEAVWAYMHASDSRECRGCHSVEAMALDEQTPRAERQHTAMLENGDTCIDCHKGVAHDLPLAYDPDVSQGPSG